VIQGGSNIHTGSEKFDISHVGKDRHHCHTQSALSLTAERSSALKCRWQAKRGANGAL